MHLWDHTEFLYIHTPATPLLLKYFGQDALHLDLQMVIVQRSPAGPRGAARLAPGPAHDQVRHATGRYLLALRGGHLPCFWVSAAEDRKPWVRDVLVCEVCLFSVSLCVRCACPLPAGSLQTDFSSRSFSSFALGASITV